MAPPAKVQIRNLSAEAYYEGPGWVPLAGRERAVPPRFVVTAELIDPPCKVQLDVVVENGVPVVQEMGVVRLVSPDGAPISASLIRRLALDTLIREGVNRVSQPLVVRDDVEGFKGRLVYQVESDIDAGRDDVAYVGPVARPLTGTGRRTSDAVLRRVAAVYRSARRAPTQAVADELHVSRSHAGRLVGQARAAGHLAATTPGRASKQKEPDGPVPESAGPRAEGAGTT